MNNYVLSIIGIVLLCAILLAVLPPGKFAAVVKGATRLVCVLAIIAPILTFLKGNDWSIGKIFDNGLLENSISTDRSFIEYYSETRIRETERRLSEELSEKYSAGVNVEIDWKFEDTTYQNIYQGQQIKIVSIHLTGIELLSEEVKNSMVHYLTENYCSEVLLE